MYIPIPDGATDKEWDAYNTEFARVFKINYEGKEEFIKSRGYKNNMVPHHLRGKHPAYYDCLEYRSGPFLSPNGKYYGTPEEFYKATKQNPLYEKDGICYGYYEVLDREKWKDALEYPKNARTLEME